MVKSRDRHGRGMRGRLSWPNPYTGRPVRVRGYLDRQAFFTSCVSDALATINRECPRVLVSVDVGIEDVPTIESWDPTGVPLAAALSPTLTSHGQVVLFRRPLERRAETRADLRQLIYRTLVEQLASITGLTTREIDPTGRSGADD